MIMFDANMRYLPKGFEFFAMANSVKEGTLLHESGLRRGDIVRCIMLGTGHDNPRVKFFTPSGFVIDRSWSDYHEAKLFDKNFTYEGNLDLTGFIDEKSKTMAAKLLEES